MNAIGIETHCGQAVEIDVVLPEDVVDGIVSVTINGIDYTANVNNGKAVIHGPADLSIGNYSNLVVTYSGGSKYADSSVKVNLTVVGANSQLKSSAAYYVIDYEQMLIISVNADNLVSGEIDAYNNGEYYSSFDVQDALENGISISSLTVGTHNITLAYKGNQYFAPANVSVLCVVEKITPVIKSNVTQDASVGDIITINATISGHTEGNVTITVDGELVYNGKTNHGVVSVDVDSIVAGKHTYIVSFLGDDNYLACDNVGTFNVVKVVPVISIGEISGNVGDTVNVVVTVAGGDASGYVLIDGVSAVVENGQATIPINILNAGENTISVVYTGDDKYNGGTQTATYAAGKYASKVTIVPIVNVTYGNVVEIAYVIDNETGRSRGGDRGADPLHQSDVDRDLQDADCPEGGKCHHIFPAPERQGMHPGDGARPLGGTCRCGGAERACDLYDRPDPRGDVGADATQGRGPDPGHGRFGDGTRGLQLRDPGHRGRPGQYPGVHRAHRGCSNGRPAHHREQDVRLQHYLRLGAVGRRRCPRGEGGAGGVRPSGRSFPEPRRGGEGRVRHLQRSRKNECQAGGTQPPDDRGGRRRGDRSRGPRASCGPVMVKSLNHLSYHDYTTDARSPEVTARRAVAVATDDRQGARLVGALVNDLGFDPVPVPWDRGRLLEPGGPVFGRWLTAQQMRELLA